MSAVVDEMEATTSTPNPGFTALYQPGLANSTNSDPPMNKAKCDEEVLQDLPSKATTANNKKRGASEINDEVNSTKKSKGNKAGEATESVKKAVRGKGKVKTENPSDDAEDEQVTRPATPPKNGRGRPKEVTGPVTPPKSPNDKAAVKLEASEADGDAEHDSDHMTVSGAKGRTTAKPLAAAKGGAARKRVAAVSGKVGKKIPISTSLETANEADKMLYEWKQDDKTWKEINDKWTELTGEKPGKSTLVNRFIRLKANFMVLKKGDDTRLINAEAQVAAHIKAAVAKLNLDKWQQVIKIMEDAGTSERYPTLFLQKQFEELVAKGAVATASTSEFGSADEDAAAPKDSATDAAEIKEEGIGENLEDQAAGMKDGEEDEGFGAAAEES